jgi:hypothetical protein
MLQSQFFKIPDFFLENPVDGDFFKGGPPAFKGIKNDSFDTFTRCR